MRKISLLILFVLYSVSSKAEEGMLIPTLLTAFESDMQAMGMEISAEDIYNANNASIKDAIFHFGGGCTSSTISAQGLLLTNHHCGYSQIYNHTTVENNIAKNGFWAKNLSEELPNPGLTATRMVRIEDVTELVFEGTEGVSNAERAQIMEVNIARIKAEAISNSHYEADIKPFYYGNSYFLLVKETFKDVRLVGTPPNAVGKFGGDIDNWIWPRHTGDFAVFRIYADANNNPNEYSVDNKPYTPIHFLPIANRARQKDDFTLVFGFPGTTEQHTISTELEYIINTLRPAQIRMRDLSLSVINAAMKKSVETEIMYATKQSRISNSWKRWIGQIDGLKRARAVDVKIKEENDYIQKTTTNEEWRNEFGEVVSALRDLSSKYNDKDFVYHMFIEYAYQGAEVFERARKIESLLSLYVNSKNSDDASDFIEAIEKEKVSLHTFFDNYDVTIDQEIFLLQSEYYKEIMEDEYLPISLLNNEVEKLQTTIYSKSFLTDREEYEKVINNFEKFAKKKIQKDPGYQLYIEVRDIFREKVLNDLRFYYGSKDPLLKSLVKGKLEMYPERKHWADANSTLRVSYGKLEWTIPRDGMKYLHYSTTDGIIEKYNTGSEDYELTPRMVELLEAKNWGDYAQDGELWVCFISSNHTTGGNSGSPVINGKGELVGLNFDRSWESTMSDYMFDSSRCRNISVDIRYVLWMIEIYGEASHIIEELHIVK